MPHIYSLCSGQQWTDCPDTESAGGNSCYFSKKHTSVLWNYYIRLVGENVTFDEHSFVISEIGESLKIPEHGYISTVMVNPLHSLQGQPCSQNMGGLQ